MSEQNTEPAVSSASAPPITKMWIYREEGGKYRVQIVSDEVKDAPPEWRSKDRFRFVTLRCVETIRASKRCGPIEPGSEWQSTCTTGEGSAYCGWSLSEDDES